MEPLRKRRSRQKMGRRKKREEKNKKGREKGTKRTRRWVQRGWQEREMKSSSKDGSI